MEFERLVAEIGVKGAVDEFRQHLQRHIDRRMIDEPGFDVRQTMTCGAFVASSRLRSGAREPKPSLLPR